MVGSSKRRFRGPSVALLAAAMSWVLLGAQVAEAAPATFGANQGIPLQLDFTLKSSLCTSTSSSVSLNANAKFLQGLGMRAHFANNAFDTQKSDGDGIVDASLVPEGTDVSSLKKAAQGGTGGNPWIMVKFEESPGVWGSNDTGWIAVGRCVQGLTYGLSKRVDLDGLQAGLLGSASCGRDKSSVRVDGSNKPGSGVPVKIRFQNSLNNPQLTSIAANGTLVTVFTGDELTKTGGWGAGGVGGNPWISAWFTDGFKGAKIGEASTPARCKDLA